MGRPAFLPLKLEANGASALLWLPPGDAALLVAALGDPAGADRVRSASGGLAIRIAAGRVELVAANDDVTGEAEDVREATIAGCRAILEAIDAGKNEREGRLSALPPNVIPISTARRRRRGGRPTA